ncbi:MAG TPA: CHAT domain-containing protein [Kofleriaceae bacterium]|nr:CHAT domain-containing protein [Kofleriaceae bacterium]
MTRPCSESDLVHALVDGQLGEVEADLVRDHLAECAACQEELADALQLAAASEELIELAAPRAPALVSVPAPVMASATTTAAATTTATADATAAPPREVEVRSIDSARSRHRMRARRIGAAAGLALPAAAAATWVLLGLGIGGPAGEAPRAAVAIALPAERGMEARVAWAPAAGHRPYGVARGDSSGARAPLAVLAELERRGDLHGVGVLYLMAGDTRQAADYLERAAEAPPAPGGRAAADRANLAADRAALELGRGDPEAALTLADGALSDAPDHQAAGWNRALALRDLGLVRGAIEELGRVAARGEPGWSTEARARARALARDADERTALDERILAGGIDLVAGGPGFAIDDARRRPGMARLFLLDALRAAPTRERALALRPLAAALDGAGTPGRLVRAVDTTAAADFARRAPLARTYAAIRAGERPTGAARARYLDAIRRAGATDLLLGALVLLGPDGRTVAGDDLVEFVRVARATGDPWFDLLAAEQEALVRTARGDLFAAESILMGALERCGAAALPYRCMRLGSMLAEVYVDLHRLPEARRALTDAWRIARTEAIGANLDNLLSAFAGLHAVSDDALGSGLALTRAYAGEMTLRHPDSCEDRAWAHELAAMVLLNQVRFADASRELAAARPAGQPCAAHPATLQGAFVAAHLLREGGSDEEVAALRADLAGLRADPTTTPAHRALIDHTEGRLLIDRDPAAGQALLEASIRAADELPAWSAEGRKARAYSYNVLAFAAARRGDADRALALLAGESGLAAPTRCALGVAIDDRLRMAVVRGADGATAIHVDEQRRTPAIDPTTLVPPALVDRLAGCDAVDVLARPPLHGLPGLLPDRLAWRYRAARRHPLEAAPPLSARPLVVSDVEPPAGLGLPRLAPWPDDGGGARVSGPEATPARVLAAMRDATAIELHAHGLVNLGESDASFLALSPDPAGRYALSAAAVRGASLDGAPLVILAACRASRVAAVLHESWSLPAAFVFAGARAVIASAEPIPDADARAFFGDLRARIAGGEVAAAALRDARRAWLAAGRGAWVESVVVFE